MPTAPELLTVDPSTLIIGANIRRDPHADTLVSSLKTNGMLHPIRARRIDDGLEVIDGQRRTLAAIQAGLTEVPVLIVDASDSGRVFEQYVSNEHREALTDAERVGTVKQLALMGLAAGTIAKRTGLPKKLVEQATTIPDTTLELVPNGSLEDLADLASLEGEPEHEAAARRLAEGDRHFFSTIVGQARKRIAAEAEAARIREQHPDLVILPTAPSYGDKQYLQLSGYEAPSLERADGTPIPSFRPRYGEPLASLEEAIEHLGAALAIHVGARSGYGDSLTELNYYLDTAQMKAAGIRKAKVASAASQKTPEQKEAEEQAREQSKAWAETADERKTFIARLLNEKQPPKGWERVVLDELLAGKGATDDVSQQAIRQMLGFDHLDVDEQDEDVNPEALLRAEILHRPDRLPFALLAVAIASIEENGVSVRVTDSYGYTYSQWKRFATHGHLAADTLAYLDQLEKWGYDAKAERDLIAAAQG